MRNQSKTNLNAQLVHVETDDSFPVSEPDFNTRTDTPNIEPHVHDMFEIGYCFDGSGVFLIGGKIFQFQAGDAVVINTHEVHLAKSDPGKTTSWGFLYLDPIRLLSENIGSVSVSLKLSRYCGADFRNIIRGTEESELADCIRLILLERRNKTQDSLSMIRALTWRMMILLDRRYRSSDFRDEESSLGDYRDIERIAPALKYITANYDRKISISKLASLCYTSESNFRKLFHRAMGSAAQPYLLKIRLNAACSMLRNTEESILSIAMRCGYESLSNFNRQFHSAYGISPRDFRKRS